MDSYCAVVVNDDITIDNARYCHCKKIIVLLDLFQLGLPSHFERN